MRPIVFLSDYGLGGELVGVCHGVMARIAAGVQVIDLTHSVPRQDVLQGAVTLARAVRFMPEDAVYLAVVDPGVGSERRPVAVEASSGALLAGPDNGLLSMAWEALGGTARAVEIASEDVLLQPVSRTFHGRDVFAPAAAHLAAGLALEALGPAVDPGSLRRMDLPGPMVTPGAIGARVVVIDGFGNVQLNVAPEDLEAAGLRGPLSFGRWTILRAATFADVPRGALAAIFDSQGFLALVVNHGSAARMLGLEAGATVRLSRASEADQLPTARPAQ
ncbi:MAG: SAM-dependent chlorinase/fluorinase [Actinomycetota bacterium]